MKTVKDWLICAVKRSLVASALPSLRERDRHVSLLVLSRAGNVEVTHIPKTLDILGLPFDRLQSTKTYFVSEAECYTL